MQLRQIFYLTKIPVVRQPELFSDCDKSVLDVCCGSSSFRGGTALGQLFLATKILCSYDDRKSSLVLMRVVLFVRRHYRMERGPIFFEAEVLSSYDAPNSSLILKCGFRSSRGAETSSFLDKDSLL